MTYAHSGQAGSDGSAFSLTATWNGPIAAHEVGLAFLSWDHGSGVSTPAGVSDTSGNTWTLIGTVTGGNPITDTTDNQSCALYICNDMAAAASAPTVTATFSSSVVVGARRLMLWSGVGLDNSNPISGTPVATWNSTASTTANSGNVTPAHNGVDLVTFCMPTSAVAVPSAGTGYTRRQVTAIGSTSESAVGDLPQLSAAATPGRWTLSASSQSIVMTIALKQRMTLDTANLPVTGSGSTPVTWNAGVSPFAGTTSAFTPPAGEMIYAIVQADDASGAVSTTISDNKGGTWNIAGKMDTGAANDIYYRVATASDTGLTVTATVSGGWNAAGDARMTIVLLAGAATDQSASAVASTTAALTVALTPTKVGSIILGSFTDDTKSGTLTANAATTIYNQASLSGGNASTYCAFRATNVSAALSATTYGFSAGTTGGRGIIAVEVAPAAAGGANYTGSPSDSVGITDSASGSITPGSGTNYTASPADTVSISDTGGVQTTDLAYTTDTENVGIADSASASLTTSGTNYTASPAENVGATDAASAVQGAARTQSDNVGLTDAASGVAAASRTQPDSVGLTDATSSAVAATRTPGDSVGLADSAAASLGFSPTPNDSLGLTDSAGSALDASRSPADSVGLTDTASPSIGYSPAPADQVGLTDSASAQVSVNISTNDAVGLTDGVTVDFVSSGSALVTDTVDATDVAATAVDVARSVADPVGLTDAISAYLDRIANVGDQVGLTDSTAAAADRVQGVTDHVGVTDAPATAADYARSTSDSVGMTDTASGTAGAVSSTNDPVGLSDAIAAQLDRVVTVDDLLALTDTQTVDFAGARSTSVDDAVGLTDALALAGDAQRSLNDTVALTDTVISDIARALVATVADTVGLSDACTEQKWSNIAVVTPNDRTLRVRAESRSLHVSPESRTLTVAPEDRTYRA